VVYLLPCHSLLHFISLMHFLHFATVFFIFLFFFFTATATTEIYTLSLHDALPISGMGSDEQVYQVPWKLIKPEDSIVAGLVLRRSEEHTSELQSRFDLVCRLLLEKKKK